MSDLEHDAYVYPGQRFARNGHVLGHGQGMTLRDWFAGQIAASLTGGIAAAGISTDISDAEKVATAAYTLSDAMIAARKGGEQ